jgi:HK97 family phage major capsid protein
MSGIETNRTNIALPGEVSSEIITKVQEQSAIMRLASKIDLPGLGTTIPIITGDPEADWVDETNVKPVSNPSLSLKNMKGYTIAVIVPFSNQFRRDMKALYDEIVRRLPGALAKKYDNTIFNGTAPGTGFDVLAGCTAESISTGSPARGIYKALVACDTGIAIAGYAANGYALSPQARGVLLETVDTTGRPIFIDAVSEGAIPRLLGQSAFYSRGVYGAGNAASGTEGQEGYVAAKDDVLGFAGDWTQARYGIVEGVTISISDQATLTVNNQMINLWERNMFAVRAEIEVGFVAMSDAFRKITRTHA